MKKIIGLVILTVLALSLVGCAKKNDDVLVIGVDDVYPPMEFRNDSNELVGFDVDFVEALAEEMGMEVEFIPTAWDGIFSALNADKFDMIVSSVSITPDRLEKFEFSKPYLSNGQVLVVTPDNDVISSSADLADKKVGVQIGTTADIAAQKQKEITDFELVAYDDIVQTFADMKTGRLDVIVVDYAVAIDFVSKHPESYKITTTQLTNEPIGICMKKGNTELKEKLDKAITALQGGDKLVEISKEWLGDDYVSNIDEELR